MKRFIFKFVNGFCYAIAITMMVQLLMITVCDSKVMLPEYTMRFENHIVAYSVQLLLMGIMSGVASGGTIILEWKRPGLIVQSMIYLILMLATWIPLACYLWGFHKYTSSMVSGILSILFTYVICWTVQYKIYKRDIQKINEKLKAKMLFTDK